MAEQDQGQQQIPEQGQARNTLPPENGEYPSYHPGIEPGVDFIYGSDQDEYKENKEEA